MRDIERARETRLAGRGRQGERGREKERKEQENWKKPPISDTACKGARGKMAAD